MPIKIEAIHAFSMSGPGHASTSCALAVGIGQMFWTKHIASRHVPVRGFSDDRSPGAIFIVCQVDGIGRPLAVRQPGRPAPLPSN